MPARVRPNRSIRQLLLLGFERVMALIALTNLLLVIFDLSYIPLRDFYLNKFPEFTVWYGAKFKGIEPNQFTRNYLQTASQLEQQILNHGLASPRSEVLLEELQESSVAMINQNPFLIANKSRTLELINARMRDRVGNQSSEQAFTEFWSQLYLAENGYTESFEFFNTSIRPLMETNYFRNLAFDGTPINRFIRIDIWFISIFAVEILIRGLLLSYRYKNLTLLNAFLWRWYDLLLVIPFSSLRLPALALLRFIPVTNRLNESRLFDLRPLQNQIVYFAISNVATQLTQVLSLRILDQVQGLVRDGQLRKLVLASGDNGVEQQRVDINDVNELVAITERVMTMVVDQVLPQMKPELDTAVNDSVQKAMGRIPGYQGVQRVPGLGQVPDRVTQQTATRISTTLYNTLYSSLSKATDLSTPDDQPPSANLLTKFIERFRAEAETGETLDEVEALLIDLVEEIKVNSVRKLSQEDYELLREVSLRLYDETQDKGKG